MLSKVEPKWMVHVEIVIKPSSADSAIEEINVAEESMMSPIFNFLNDGKLLNEPIEASKINAKAYSYCFHNG